MRARGLLGTDPVRGLGILALVGGLLGTFPAAAQERTSAPLPPPEQVPAVRLQFGQDNLSLDRERTLIGGLPTVHPVVPQRPPRSSAGEFESGQDTVSIPKFIESVKGNDAAIQLVVGQGRMLTLKAAIPAGAGPRFIAVGDPSMVDFEVLPNHRMIRLLGKRPGITDLSVVTAEGQTFSFEIHVTWDLTLLQIQLKQMFPDAEIRLSQMRDHIVVEGQARSPAQSSQIMQAIEAYQRSAQIEPRIPAGVPASQPPAQAPAPSDVNFAPMEGEGLQTLGGDSGLNATASVVARPQVINLLRVPGVQQVMLQVKIAELNRTAIRQIGADMLGFDPNTGTTVGTVLNGSKVNTAASSTSGGLANGLATLLLGPQTTAFGIFPTDNFSILLSALRRNSMLTILAEPNLVAMSGQEASFLAGGQFPVPVPQVSNGVANSITVQFKNFGVQLNFIPTVLDEETIRLAVNPEVSSIDFTLGTPIVQGGQPIPGLNTRRASTTVEIHQGETLAIAGLLSVQIDGQTARIPGIGDLPYIGPLFSNTSHQRVEKELLIMVTPVLVQPVPCDVVPPLPGTEIQDPTDLEFYFKNRIEGRTDRNFRSTVPWASRPHSQLQQQYELHHVQGTIGFSE